MRLGQISVLGLLAALGFQAAASAAIVEVRIFSNEYSANPIGQPILDPTIFVGDTIRWRWTGGTHSTKSAAGQLESWTSPTTGVINTTYDHVFNNVGVFNYYCTLHGFDAGGGNAGGMAGRVTVIQPSVVSIGSTPNDEIDIVVTPADRNGETDGPTPLTRTYAPTTSVTLTAPLRPTGFVFLYWVVASVPQTLGQNVLTRTYPTSSSVVAAYSPVGDMNCDGALNNFDIDPFIVALLTPNQYAIDYPGCNPLNGDADESGLLNNFDIDPFVGLLLTN